ncbi:MAG TPA: Mur ligase family protein, partial [Pseudidiomarina sp.]|nr:Mur ligase family protein [Pseudidiomarina sp.]
MPVMLNKSLAQYDTVGVVGIGQTGLSVVRHLLAQGVEPVVFDTREQPASLAALTEIHAGLEVQLGPLDPALLLQMDILVVSPGVDLRLPELQLAADADIPLIGDIDIFARLATKPVIGITGSNGKSTVTRLTAALLEAAGKRVAIAGNIGIPVLDVVAMDAELDLYVLELSSFQLELMQSLSLAAATVLNVSDDHMDRYYTRRDYVDAKQRIYQNARWAVW